ncbi:hypothetical protein K9U39_15125 [Rhodoblastus acidophilus]|uniref:Uncharacterized protein n=1 Tax=Candidatus Rhodoblastus alkanivorans TaxID=2954117 RepID=A0ABS9Z0M9_9HYPH|nr:hypothetical protein [Candidatus Rhodoblastus alkanivorans]MCI4678164.1 hypothetical protein [Candidatus Rhodoblastus alkanivorans]MCI4681214.1 hypothetical protein [Candidatus Rhodoblastus alkanivorans]MDI4642257.1 hypothetical protein [Rhodoblastus acidophilus]
MSLDLIRLGKLLSLAGSDNESEAIAAVRKLKDHLSSEGLSFTDLGQTLIGQGERRSDGGQRPQAREPATNTFTDETGVVWPSRRAYEKYQAAAAARREDDWRKTETERNEVIARYGSREAALARNDREQMLHDATADLLVRCEPDTNPPGRWHASLGGWDRSSFVPLSPTVMARIEQAFPLPKTVRQAKDEFDYWKQRSNELEMLMGRPEDSQLDLPAICRAQRVQALYEHELPIRSIDDLHLRLQFTVKPEWTDDTGKALPDILEAFEALIVAPP